MSKNISRKRKLIASWLLGALLMLLVAFFIFFQVINGPVRSSGDPAPSVANEHAK